MKESFDAVIENFKEGNIIGGIIGGVNLALVGLGTAFLVGSSIVGQILRSIFDAFVTWFKFLRTLPDKMAKNLLEKFEWFKDIGPKIWKILRSAFESARDFIVNGIKSVFKPREGGIISKAKDFLGFAQGGIVPGPIGAPQLAVVHGGEEVLTPGQRGGTMIFNINNPVVRTDRDLKRIAEEVSRVLAVQSGRRHV